MGWTEPAAETGVLEKKSFLSPLAVCSIAEDMRVQED